MRTIQVIACLFLIGVSTVAFAQKNYTKTADKMFNSEAYYDATDWYKKAYSQTNNPAEKARIIYQIATCYRHMHQLDQAALWYAKAIKAKYPDQEAYLQLATMQKQLGNYADAVVQYNKYKEKVPAASVDHYIESCKQAQEWIDNPTRYTVYPEILLNSPQFDFSPTIGPKNNMVVLTSSREGSTGDKMDWHFGESFQDLYIATRDKKGKWSEPVLLNSTINTEHNEGAACFNSKRNTLYFTRCMNIKDRNMGCDIYMAPKRGNNWGDAVLIRTKPDMGGDEDSIMVGHPALTPNDEWMVFASNMPGGYGGKDLWKMKYDKRTKTWSKPENLGAAINTAGDEAFPHIASTGQLFFASDGIPGMGGLDVYKASATGEATWGEPTNMMSPINSSSDDFGIVFERGEDKGYFSSNRPGGKGQDDIYHFSYQPLLVKLICNVYDKDTKAPIPYANINVAGTDNSLYEVKTNENGQFEFDALRDERYINPGYTYTIRVDKEDYLVANDKITTVGLEESTTFIKEFYIQVTDTVISLPEVRYALDEWELLVNNEVSSTDSLDFLYQVLIDNPTIVIELQAHTDHQGKAIYNKRLSQKRAQACVAYLTQKGIPAERMVPKGYGEERLKISETTIRKMKTKEERDKAHQVNRRTEFKVLSFDYVPKSVNKNEQ